MKNIICLFLIVIFSTNAFGDCVWKTGITPGPNNTFVYNQVCHQEVGKLVQANKDLTAALQLKDLALQTSDQRVQMWTKTAESEQDRMLKLSSDEKKSDWTMFALGCLTVLGTGYVTAKLVGK